MIESGETSVIPTNLTIDQMRTILDTLNTDGNIGEAGTADSTTLVLFALLFSTGLRVSEIVGSISNISGRTRTPSRSMVSNMSKRSRCCG